MKSIDTLFDEKVKAHPRESLEQVDWLDAELAHHQCQFGKNVIPSFIKPYFLSHKEAEDLKHASRVIGRMLEKVVRGYFRYPEIQPIFEIHPEEKPYIEMDPGYKKSIIISRPDGFLVNGVMQFIEFNCDSPAGSGYSDVQEKILGQSLYLKSLKAHFKWGRASRLSGLLRALLACGKEFGLRKRPHIAIVDWKHVKTLGEFDITRTYFESQGYPTVIVDPRQLQLRNGKLYAGNFRVDLIYRRVIFKELWDKRDDVKDFLKAYRLGKVCVVNPFRSRLAANKAVLSILTNSVYDFLFNKEERSVRDRHIPWTRRVIDAKKFYGGQTNRLSDLIIHFQESLVLKPAVGYGGRDVHIGRETSKTKWKRILATALRGGERWVVQDYVPIPTMTVPILKGKTVKVVEKKINLNPFVFGGKYVGSMARLSDESVINVSAGGGLIPAIKYSRK